MEKNSDLMFDEGCYKTIPDADRALSYVRYYTQKAAEFHDQLLRRGWTDEEAMDLVDKLWSRIIDGCKRFGVPLTTGAEHVAARLGL